MEALASLVALEDSVAVAFGAQLLLLIRHELVVKALLAPLLEQQIRSSIAQRSQFEPRRVLQPPSDFVLLLLAPNLLLFRHCPLQLTG